MVDINYRMAQCCESCKHYQYSTRSLSSWCNKHVISDDDWEETGICDDWE